MAKINVPEPEYAIITFKASLATQTGTTIPVSLRIEPSVLEILKQHQNEELILEIKDIGRLEQQKCEQCGKIYTPSRRGSGQKFCSARCRGINFRENKKRS